MSESLTVLIPVYRAEENLTELYDGLTKVLTRLGNEYEILFVEDCGGDRSWEMITALAANDVHVLGLRHSRNFGQHNALLSGIRVAKGELILTMDDDLQHPPECIPVLMDKLRQGYDVVYGTPQEERHGFWRDVASQWIKFAMQIAMGIPTARSVSALRIFRTALRNAFADYNSPYVSIDVLLTWGTTRFGTVPIAFAERKRGQSGYTVRKLISHTFNMLTGFSTVPLRIASLLGFVFTVFGLLVLMYVVGRYIVEGTSVAGFPFLASVIAIFSGVQLFTLGIIGEYLARLYVRSMGRPASVVQERVGLTEKVESNG